MPSLLSLIQTILKGTGIELSDILLDSEKNIIKVIGSQNGGPLYQEIDVTSLKRSLCDSPTSSEAGEPR